jgi:hypothetical protein
MQSVRRLAKEAILKREVKDKPTNHLYQLPPAATYSLVKETGRITSIASRKWTENGQ